MPVFGGHTAPLSYISSRQVLYHFKAYIDPLITLCRIVTYMFHLAEFQCHLLLHDLLETLGPAGGCRLGGRVWTTRAHQLLVLLVLLCLNLLGQGLIYSENRPINVLRYRNLSFISMRKLENVNVLTKYIVLTLFFSNSIKKATPYAKNNLPTRITGVNVCMG